MSSSSTEPKVKLTSKEGTSFEVPLSVAKMSNLVQTLLPTDEQMLDMTTEQIQDMCEFPLPAVKDTVLAKVVDFCTHFQTEPMENIERPLKSSQIAEVVSDPWYAAFVDVEQDMLFELILAANFMDIQPLLDLTCATVATLLKGKTPEEIRQTFNIVNDFTPEEEAQIRKENEWCED